MGIMKRFWLLVAGFAPALIMSGLPTAASAQIVELGQTTTMPIVAPTCPQGTTASSCKIVLTRTTAVQGMANGLLNPTKVTKAGWIVAFTVGLSKLSSSPKTELTYLRGLDSQYGGTPQVALTVLKPGPQNKYTVAAESATYHLIPFLGQVVQEPLSLPPAFATFTALPVVPGEVVGLTVPTWAPVLSYALTASKYSYRQSRTANCQNPPGTQTAQTTVGMNTRYVCSYSGTRVEYSATEVVNQPYPKTYVHTKRRRR